MEKKKLRLQVKDNCDNISAVYIRYFRVEPAVSTPTLLHPASVSRRGSPWNWTKVDRGPSSAMHLCPVWHKDPTLSWIQEIGTDRCWVNSPGSASGMMWKQATQETPHKQGVTCWPRQPAPSTPAREGTGDASGPQPERQQSGLTVKGMLKIWQAWF